MKKTYFKKDSPKPCKIGNIHKLCVQITIDNLKQIKLRKEEAIPNFLMEINKYKHINMQTLQSQVQDLVENEETPEETQRQANHETRESSPGFFCP